MSQTKPGTLLRRQIPALVDPRKAEDGPGYREIDVISHSGEYAASTFLYNLPRVVLVTGWTERVPLLGKGPPGVVAGLDQMCHQLAFRLRGLHLDTGSEFSNIALLKYCRERELAFNSSTSYHKNGNRHGERGNWTAVRRQIGFDGLEG